MGISSEYKRKQIMCDSNCCLLQTKCHGISAETLKKQQQQQIKTNSRFFPKQIAVRCISKVTEFVFVS